MTKTPDNWESYSDHFKYLEVEINSSFEDSFRIFKSLVQKSRIISDYKESQRYEKPSEKKRRKRREAQERNRLNNLKEEQMASGEWDKKQKRIEQRRQEKIEKKNKKINDESLF